MSRTFVRQDTQIRNSDAYVQLTAPSLANYQTTPTNIEDDLNNVRSQLNNLLTVQTGNWYDDINLPVTFENGAKRGVRSLNQDLHDLQRKRVLVSSTNLSDVVVPALQNYVVLALSEIPSNTTAAIGIVTTRGTVAATNGTFGAHSLALVGGSSAIDPKNLCDIVDGSTRDPITSSGRQVWALFQTESATDGSTMTGTTPDRAQLSFVRLNATGDALEACPVADIAGKTINYASVERKALEDLNEQDFLRGAVIDSPASATVSRQIAYDNQGTTPVELTTNADLDLNSAGIFWEIRDLLNASLFKITEGTGGGTSTLAFGTDVDTFDNNAIVNDFSTGLRANTSGTRIDVGVTAGYIDTSAGVTDLGVRAGLELYLDDGNQTGSTWAQTAGIKLSDTTAEWDAYETAFGAEVSLLYGIGQAKRRPKVYARVTSTTSADTDVGGVGGGINLDAQLPDMSIGAYLTDYDVFLNGVLLRPGANSAANHDYYPGSSTLNGQVKFEFTVKVNDQICVTPYVR